MLIFDGQLAIERDDIPMKAYPTTRQQKKAMLLYQCGIEAYQQIERREILSGIYGGYAYVIHPFGTNGHGAKLEVTTGWNMRFGGIAVFGQPSVDMRVVGMRKAEAAIKYQREC